MGVEGEGRILISEVLMLRKWICLMMLVGVAWGEPVARGDVAIPNMYHVKESMREYFKSGRYHAEVDSVAQQARTYLENSLPRLRDRRLAVVLDIDETVLSNYPHIEAQDFGYIPKPWVDWVLQSEAPALRGPREFFHYAVQNNVDVVFITGRAEPQRDATVRNLEKEGMASFKQLIMKPKGDPTPSGAYKAQARRQLVESGYTIVVNLGDQDSDLAGGYAESVFKLPNPMYYVP